ncbi:MAG: protein translocase subunit SecD [Aquabacterium sp.]|nr:MAG: protein translocase subunit SecD [Aquabacterium sp.]
MNRYPWWKYAIIGFVLLVGVVYTLPNFFGEAPAVQVSSAKATVKVDPAQVALATKALQDAGARAESVDFEAGSIRARFLDTDTQLKARDALTKAFVPQKDDADYVVALNLVSNVPAWLSKLRVAIAEPRPTYLGLDLRGGVHFLLQVDMKAALAKKLQSYEVGLRTSLREKNMRHTGIRVSADRIDVRFRDAASAEAAKNTASDVAPEMTWQVLPQDDQTTLLAGTLKPAAVQSIQQEALRQNVVTLSNRVNNLGVAEPVIQQQGNDRIVVQLPGVQDVAKAKTIIGRTATLEFRMVEAHAADPNARDYDPQKIADARNGILPPNTQVLQVKRDRPETLLVARQPIITGENLTSATADQDSQGRGAIVNVVLDSAGASIMKSVTRDSVKRRMAVLLIEKGVVEVLTAPTIQSELGNRFQISGMVNLQEASDLALLMRSGSLAAPMEIIEERTVGPSLGKENIAQGFHSVLWGFAAIAVFMCLYYMLFGVFSSIALAINVLLLIALLSMLQATLTLPGIAAIALALGMAIDSNVLINERIREELRNGSSPQTAISVGYERAWATILDSNVTTLIAGVALLAFGSGPVRGFAVVHCLGILTSMFSAVFFSRGLVNLWYGGRKRLKSVAIGQVWRPEGSGTDTPVKSS